MDPIPASNQIQQTHNEDHKKSLIAVAVVVVLIAGYVVFSKYMPSVPAGEVEGARNLPAASFVSTPLVNGAVVPPEGLPNDIPYEELNITQSASVDHPDQDARQLVMNYTSSKPADQVYADYKEYMISKGYKIIEGSETSPTLTIFGSSDKADLSMSVGTQGEKVLVQVSYLIK